MADLIGEVSFFRGDRCLPGEELSRMRRSKVSYLATAKLPAARAGLTALDSIVRRLADHETVNEQC